MVNKGKLRVALGEIPLICCADPTNKSSIPTLLDSGAIMLELKIPSKGSTRGYTALYSLGGERSRVY